MDNEKIVDRLQLIAIVQFIVGIIISILTAGLTFLSIHSSITLITLYGAAANQLGLSLKTLKVCRVLLPILVLILGIWLTWVFHTYKLAFARFLENSERSDISNSIDKLTRVLSGKENKFKI